MGDYKVVAPFKRLTRIYKGDILGWFSLERHGLRKYALNQLAEWRNPQKDGRCFIRGKNISDMNEELAARSRK